jgi:hypothetical protein
VDLFLSHGQSGFDTARSYGYGTSEEVCPQIHLMNTYWLYGPEVLWKAWSSWFSCRYEVLCFAITYTTRRLITFCLQDRSYGAWCLCTRQATVDLPRVSPSSSPSKNRCILPPRSRQKR